MDVAAGLKKLRVRLPLQQRQAELAPNLRKLHRAILRSFYAAGAPPPRAQLGTSLPVGELANALETLVGSDLIVLGADGEVVGAYPFTTATTPHRLAVESHSVNAMCALDALAVAPMFGAAVTIDSVCEVTGEAIQITQRADVVIDARPSPGIHVGIQWQREGGVAAATL